MSDLGELVIANRYLLPHRWARMADSQMFRLDFGLADGTTVGHMIVAVDLCWIGYVHVEPGFRGRGYGIEIHRRVVAKTGMLLVEQQCSKEEKRLIAGLRKRPEWLVDLDPSATYGGLPAHRLRLAQPAASIGTP